NFYFTDNTFNIPGSYALQLCRRLMERKLEISWTCIVYPGNFDETLVRAMAQAGCREVSLGFESGCERILRIMNKHFTLKDVRRASELLAHHKIRQMGFLLLGGPGETRESVEESLAFADSLPLDALKISAGIRIYPYTALAQTAVAEGVICADDDLLTPKFYMAAGLEEWLRETVKNWMSTRPHWIM
ncbi:MAG: radical SAM protein, partial [Proteobacteria bacterium]|nr:radical SAM protein [Pseudomonadota bacterium]